MKTTPLYRHLFALTAFACLAASLPLRAITPGEWRHRQTLDVPSAGLVRAELPPETLAAARNGLEDLRVLDATGNEVPYLVERLGPRPGSAFAPKNFRYSADAGAQTTTLLIEPGTSEPLEAVSLETPAANFLKPARVEGSGDGETWRELIAGQPVFRQPGGVENRRIPLDGTAWKYLRITLDDSRSVPVPFTGARLHSPGEAAPTVPVPVTLKSRDENPGVTRLALDLGAANLPMASVRIETAEPLFTRDVSIAVPEVSGEGICERSVGHAVIYRLALDGRSEARLEIPLEKQIQSRELILLIRNQDSPPLTITGVGGDQRLTRLVFFAREPGVYLLLTGNSQCPPPRYDLAALGPQLRKEEAASPAPLLVPSHLADTPGYQAPEAMGTLVPTGAPIDLAGWRFRKPVQLAERGVQQLELDPETLAHGARDFSDLRLVSDGRQIPYLLERPSISRTVPLEAAIVAVPKRPALSRWSLKLPQARLPINRLGCVSPSPLFQRDLVVWEEQSTDRGEKYRRELGRATWRQTPGTPARELAVSLAQLPETNTLFLETENGDNPPVELRDFRCYYPVTRMVFKAGSDAARPVWLYYGNASTGAPRYDLRLIASQLLGAGKSQATMGPGQPVQPPAPAPEKETTQAGGILFWSVLALVVVALLAIVSRLLPKSEQP